MPLNNFFEKKVRKKSERKYLFDFTIRMGVFSQLKKKIRVIGNRR